MKAGGRNLTTPRSAGIAGIAFAVLFATSILMSRAFVTLAPDELADAAAGSLHQTASLLTSYLIPFSGIAFLWFIGVVRDRIGEAEDRFFATVFLSSGVLFVAMMFGAAAVVAALLSLEVSTPETIELGRWIARAMLYMYGARSAGVFTLVTSTILLRTQVAPKWAAILGVAVGLSLLLSVQWFDLVILAFPAWVALLSVLILVHAHAVAAEKT